MQRRTAKLLTFAALMAALLVLWRVSPIGNMITEWVGAAATLRDRPWAAAAFLAFYALAIAFGCPGTPLTLLGGAAFGLWQGFALNLVGATLGAALAFWEARSLGGNLLHHHLWPRLRKELELPRSAFLTFLKLRLLPVIPFGALNFAAGLTKTRFRPYLLGTAIGIIPSTLAWTYFARSLDSGTEERSWLRLAIALSCLLLGDLAGAPGHSRVVRAAQR